MKDGHPPLLRILFLLCVLLVACGPASESRLQPSGHAVPALAEGQPFARYEEQSRQRIRQALQQGPFSRSASPFGPAYTLEQVVAMRSPWQITPADFCAEQARTGTAFLFIHGLSDSPYTVRAIARSLAESRPCDLFRSVLLPGHGTTPGDLLTVHRDQWRATVDQAVQQLLDQSDTVHLVGYSTGAALALEQADRRRDDPGLSALILLSPALDLGNPLGWLTPILRHVQPWLGVAPDRDAAKYESFPMNAAAQAHLLLKELAPHEMEPLQRKVFMVATGNDTTVDAEAARKFFCEKTASGQRHMLWYYSSKTGGQAYVTCEGLEQVDARMQTLRVVTLSHVGTAQPPTDEHYGYNGHYRQCLSYAGDDTLAERCHLSEPDTVYGEPGIITDGNGLYRERLVRRTTFNPHYDAMIRSLDCFLREDCRP